MSKRLLGITISFYQIVKILDFSNVMIHMKIYFKKCEFRQRTSVLSYFVLKSYFLFHSDKFMDCINFTNLGTRFNCIKEINLNDKKFGNCINVLLKFYRGKFDKCMRMSFPF